MNELRSEQVNWSPNDMLEVTIKQPDDFLKIRETLTRMGVASRKDRTLYQSCHILHKKGKYFITHFKELFALDGKPASLVKNDIERRNTIATLLADWELIEIVDTNKVLIKLVKRYLKNAPKGWNSQKQREFNLMKEEG